MGTALHILAESFWLSGELFFHSLLWGFLGFFCFALIPDVFLAIVFVEKLIAGCCRVRDSRLN